VRIVGLICGESARSCGLLRGRLTPTVEIEEHPVEKLPNSDESQKEELVLGKTGVRVCVWDER
jgi:hypothetical protein